jgi:hypothetical protein
MNATIALFFWLVGLLVVSLVDVWWAEAPTGCDPGDVPIIYDDGDLYT